MNAIQPGQIFFRGRPEAGGGIVVIIAINGTNITTMRSDMSTFIIPAKKVKLWINCDLWKQIS